MKRALVCGASGLIGSHMIKRLKAEGYFVRGVSRRQPTVTQCDEYVETDLREIMCNDPIFKDIDWVMQFACEVGGLGYIENHNNDIEMLRNSMQIDMAVLEAAWHCKSIRAHSPRVFFASSACVYNVPGKRFYVEDDAYPANCNNEFAWQKLYAERLYLAYARTLGLDIRIGRLFNTYGVGMEWHGGREKSVAALCRKIAEAADGAAIEVWGNGEQTRSYTHVDDAVEGIWRLMNSHFTQPLNIGPAHEVSIRDLVQAIRRQASKSLLLKFGEGPSGVSKICSDNALIRLALDWEPQITIEQGLETIYPWIEKMVLDRKQKTA